MYLTRLFPFKLAMTKVQLFTTKIQSVQALSFAFQDTFRNTFFFAVIGSIFFVFIVIVKRKEARMAEV